MTNKVSDKERDKMANCRYCVNVDICQYIVDSEDCEDFEETFEHHWEMMDDIEREEYSQAERSDKE